MNVEELWTTLRRRESLSYPFNPQRSITPETNDPFNRDIRRLFKSFILLGKKMLDNPDLPRDKDEMDKIARMIRVIEGGLEFRDLQEFSLRFGMTSTKTSTVLFCQRVLSPDDALDWNVLRQVVILHCISPSKAAVYYIMINTGVIDVFAIGPSETVELQQFGLQILTFFERVLPDVNFSFAYRFKIPRSLDRDVLMMAFIFALQLHRHGKYLLLSQSTLVLYKLRAFKEFHETHDNWLGNIRSKSEYPFIKERNKDELFLDEGGKLTEKGYVLLDVPGDGNCGFFSLILGMENHNKKAYNPLHVDETGQPVDANASGWFDLEQKWQAQTIRLRRDLRNHSIHLLTQRYKRGQEPEWWWSIGPLSTKDRKENNDSFFIPGYDRKFYFGGKHNKLHKKHHMMATWGPFVFASLFKMRVITIMRTIRPNKKGEIIVEWSTWIFSRRDNVEPRQEEGIYRMPDDEFKRHPTIEIYYMGGEGVDNHFQFLRRGYCDDAAAPLKPELSDETLLSILKRQFKKNSTIRTPENAMDAHKTRTAESITNEAGRKDVPDQGKHPSHERTHEPLLPQPGVDADDSEREQVSDVTNEVPEQDKRMEVDNSERERLPDVTNEAEIEEVPDQEKQMEVNDSERATLPDVTFEVEREAVPDQDKPMEVDDSEREKLPDESFGIYDSDLGVDDSHLEPDDLVEAEPINEPLQDQGEGSLNLSQGKAPMKGLSRGKTPRKRLSTVSGPDSASSKKNRTRKGKELEEYDEDYFDSQYWAGTSKHHSPARMKYDSVLETFWVCFAVHGKITEAQSCDDIDRYDVKLVNQARRIPDVWHGCSIGDTIESTVPSHLTTNVPTLYQQFNRRFCLTYSLASALFYCGFDDAARILDSQARVFALLLFDEQLNRMKDLMPGLVPLIGRPTIYNQRRCHNKQKKTTKKARCMTWDCLFDEIVPHPTLIVPVMPDGKTSHAFCIVDDLIFDSSFPFALKLQRESIEWLYGDPNIEIYQVIRFNMKCSPKGHKVEGLYKRDVTLNWIGPSRVFVRRDGATWNLPHYVGEK